MDNVRILKGYSKYEQKELENAKKHIDCSDLLHIITAFISGTIFDLIWSKYNESEPDERISIIRDIIDFYTGKAKFADPKKYYVKLIKNSDFSYLYRSKLTNFLILDGCSLSQDYQTEFTEQEINDIDPRYMQFAVEVEAD